MAEDEILFFNAGRAVDGEAGDGAIDFEEALEGTFLTDRQLRELAETEDLTSVTHLELIVDTTVTSMGNLGERLPALTQLKLNNSRVPSLRDLGTSMSRLRVLWLARSELKDLAGIGAFEGIRELYLSYNDISDVTPLVGLDELEVLDLEGNCVSDMEQVLMLAACPRLGTLSLDSNPVAGAAEYRATVLEGIPQLQYLDDFPRDSAPPPPVSDDEDLLLAHSPLPLASPRLASALHSQAGEGTITVADERKVVTLGIKYARHGFDDVYFSLPGLEDYMDEASPDFSGPAADGTRPAQGAMTPRTARPMSAAYSHLPRRPGTAARPASALRKPLVSAPPPGPRLGSAVRPVSSGRPGSASSNRPGSGASGSAGRPGSAGGSRLNLPLDIHGARAHDADASSQLTYGAEQHLCGNAATALRTARARRGSGAETAGRGPGGRRGGAGALGDEEVLSHLRQWKIETASIALQDYDDNELADLPASGGASPSPRPSPGPGPLPTARPRSPAPPALGLAAGQPGAGGGGLPRDGRLGLRRGQRARRVRPVIDAFAERGPPPPVPPRPPLPRPPAPLRSEAEPPVVPPKPPPRPAHLRT
eukprot:tig00001415_g8680.t1